MMRLIQQAIFHGDFCVAARPTSGLPQGREPLNISKRPMASTLALQHLVFRSASCEP